MDLHEAAKAGDLQWIVDNPSSVKAIHEDTDAALSIAAIRGHLDIVKYLHRHGADITADDSCALRWAAHFGHIEVVWYLHQNGADLTVDDDYTVRWASRNGHLDIVKYCTENGADITVADNFAVKWSSYKGHFEVVKLLLDNGADPFAIDATTKKLRTLVAENFLERLDLSALSDTPITKKFLSTFENNFKIKIRVFGSALKSVSSTQCQFLR